LLLDDVAYIDHEMHESFDATELYVSDVLLNITGASIGRSAVAGRAAVELRFTDAQTGSLIIEAELPNEDSPVLFENDFDLGKQAIELAYNFAARLNTSDLTGLSDLVPDRQERAMLLRTIESMSPDPAENYSITFANGSPVLPGVSLTGASRQRARMMLLQQSIDDSESAREATVVGTLTKIHYDVGPQKIAVRVGPGNEVDCFYDDSLRDQVSNLCAGSIVEVVGIATLDVEGRVKQIDSVTGVETVSMEPIRISNFEHAGRRHHLREAVPFSIEFADGVWAYGNDALGIRGFAVRREDALRELHEAFDFAYRDIGLADENQLIGKAIDMKHEFQRLVQVNGGV